MNESTKASYPAPPATWNEAPASALLQAANQPPAGYASPQQGPAKRGEGAVELWLGRYAIGVVAAVLVFLGAAYFAISFIPLFSDEMKVLVMFALSLTLAVAGSALAIVRRNGFTTALMGCGAGSLFISVLVTYMHFGLIPELASFGLILIWMVLCLALVRVTQSLLLDIVLQLGLVVSVCLGAAGGFDVDKLPLIMGYQLVASVIVVGGNMMFCRKMYRSSLVVALSLSLVTSAYVWFNCGALDLFVFDRESAWPISLLAGVFALQFVSASAYAALLAGLVIRGRADTCEGGGEPRRSTKRETALLAADATLWLNSVRINVALPFAYCMHRIAATGTGLPEDLGYYIGTLLMLAVVGGAGVALAVYGRRHGVGIVRDSLNPALTIMAIAGAVTALLGSLSTTGVDFPIPVGFLWAWAVMLVMFGVKAGGRRYAVMGIVCLCSEALVAASCTYLGLPARYGYEIAMALGAAYAVLLCVLAAWAMGKCGWNRAGTVVVAVMSTVLVMSYFANCTPLLADGWVWSMSCMVCAFIWVALGFAMRHSQLRLCGLVVVLLCVAKLVLIDLAGLDPTSRMVAYICGGLICFIVSALYNFATKRLEASR